MKRVRGGKVTPQLGAERPTVYASWSNPRPAGEDCLVLNVYTPGLSDGAKRPVMVWLHGGGFAIGATILSGDTLWSSATPGGITKTAADQVSGIYSTPIGVMISTTLAKIKIIPGGLIA